MSSSLQTKTDQAIRTLTPEQLAEYAFRDIWQSLKREYNGEITKEERLDGAAVFVKKYVHPLGSSKYDSYNKTLCRLDRTEENRSMYSSSFTYMTETVSFIQGLLSIVDRLMDVGYSVQEGRTPDPDELEWTLSHAEDIIPLALSISERRRKDISDLLEFIPEYVTFPQGEELIPTPQEVRDYMAKKETGEEYHGPYSDPYEMPKIRLAKRLGVETEGRDYKDVSKQVRDALYNVEHWDEDLEDDQDT